MAKYVEGSMNVVEMMRALMDGKAVRCISWAPGEYMRLCGDEIVDENDAECFFQFDYQDEFVIYEHGSTSRAKMVPKLNVDNKTLKRYTVILMDGSVEQSNWTSKSFDGYYTNLSITRVVKVESKVLAC